MLIPPTVSTTENLFGTASKYSSHLPYLHSVIEDAIMATSDTTDRALEAVDDWMANFDQFWRLLPETDKFKQSGSPNLPKFFWRLLEDTSGAGHSVILLNLLLVIVGPVCKNGKNIRKYGGLIETANRIDVAPEPYSDRMNDVAMGICLRIRELGQEILEWIVTSFVIEPPEGALAAEHGSQVAANLVGGKAGSLEIFQMMVLKRDHNKCVISNDFDEELSSHTPSGHQPEGPGEQPQPSPLQVTHIIPRWLATKGEKVISLFDSTPPEEPLLGRLLDSVRIDIPNNGITLRQDLCHLFRHLQLWFELQSEDEQAYYYDVKSKVKIEGVAVRTTFLKGPGCPLSRAVQVHANICRVVNAAGGKEVVDAITEDVKTREGEKQQSGNLEELAAKLKIGEMEE